jgi:proteic killer suppression protein
LTPITLHVTIRKMIKNFRHKGLKRFFESGDFSGINADHASKLRLILARLAAACSVQDMALPGLKLHPLKGSMKGKYAVTVNGNWRVIFNFIGKDAVDIDYLDYH